jgi:hypothetical protein
MAGINFKAFDLGGHEIARRVWKDYYAKVCLVRARREGERERGGERDRARRRRARKRADTRAR